MELHNLIHQFMGVLGNVVAFLLLSLTITGERSRPPPPPSFDSRFFSPRTKVHIRSHLAAIAALAGTRQLMVGNRFESLS